MRLLVQRSCNICLSHYVTRRVKVPLSAPQSLLPRATPQGKGGHLIQVHRPQDHPSNNCLSPGILAVLTSLLTVLSNLLTWFTVPSVYSQSFNNSTNSYNESINSFVEFTIHSSINLLTFSPVLLIRFTAYPDPLLTRFTDYIFIQTYYSYFYINMIRFKCYSNPQKHSRS